MSEEKPDAERRLLLERIADIETTLVEQRQDIKQLVRWLELVDQDVQRHFRSWSWRIGHTAVGLAKKFMRSDHPPASAYRLSRILESFRKWKNNRQEYTTPDRVVGARVEAGLTILAGTLDPDRTEQCKTLADEQSTQVIAFSGAGTDPVAELAGKGTQTSVFAIEDFPGFHRTLSSALARIGSKRLVVLDEGLLGLGLGLLANYHSGIPLVMIGSRRESSDGGQTNQEDPRLADPRDPAWTGLLQSLAKDVSLIEDPRTWMKDEALEPGILPAARKFADWFARFHQRHGTGP